VAGNSRHVMCHVMLNGPVRPNTIIIIIIVIVIVIVIVISLDGFLRNGIATQL
jgi:hypothetical protein